MTMRERILIDGAIPAKYKLLMAMITDAIAAHPAGVTAACADGTNRCRQLPRAQLRSYFRARSGWRGTGLICQAGGVLLTQNGAPTQDFSLRSRSSTTSLTTWSAAAARIMALIPRARVIVLTGWSSSTLALASQRFRT